MPITVRVGRTRLPWMIYLGFVAVLGCPNGGAETTVRQARTKDLSLARAGGPLDPETSSRGEADQTAGGRKHSQTSDDERAGGAEQRHAQSAPANPFRHRIPAPEFPPDMAWLNTGGPLRLRDLRGKFVLLDFWTYCCINCMHILPELKKLEHAYPDQLVVIGVHSAKFDTEKSTENIAEAILRYEIGHPVINDEQHRVWDTYGARSWPTILLIDPEGNVVYGRSGEFVFEQIDQVLKAAMPYYRFHKLVDETPIRFDLLANRQQVTPLRFPGKVLADDPGQRLFISDSNHNRIVVTSLDGKLIEIIGAGTMGRNDGGYAQATFDHPQGMALSGDTLYVADTENHLIRAVDLRSKVVSTIAGTGVQGRVGWPGAEELDVDDPFSRSQAQPGNEKMPKRWVGVPKETAINSPWALWVDGDQLLIAMAGPHQIWRMSLRQPEIEPYAGNGREDIVDGPLLPPFPYQLGFCSFAQPSGLASDGHWLFVADSEGSSIRAVPLRGQNEVRTILGTASLPVNRLFTFGDRDGELDKAFLQHPLDVVYHDGRIYIADTYNNKIKMIDQRENTIRTIAGTGAPGHDDRAPTFDEPAGISHAAGKLYVADTNNHRIRTIDLDGGYRVSTLSIAGLTPPTARGGSPESHFRGAETRNIPVQAVRPINESITVSVELKLPDGWKLNSLAPIRYLAEAVGEQGPIDRAALGKLSSVEPPVSQFEFQLPVSGVGQEDQVRVSIVYYYCRPGAEGLCRVGSIVWSIPLELSSGAEQTRVILHHSPND